MIRTAEKQKRFLEAARNEKPTVPEVIQARPAKRYPAGIRKAFLKNDFSTGSTVNCYLDTDSTGMEVTVYFSLPPGTSNLSDCEPSLKDGQWVGVFYNNLDGQWQALCGLAGAQDCS